VWHPVGQLPPAVYWRRRVLVLTLLLVVLGGLGWLGWLGYTQLSGRNGTDDATGAASGSSVRTPALERVVPTLAAVATPIPPSLPPPAALAAAPRAAPKPVAGGPCTDAMIGLAVGTPAAVAVGSKPTFELVVKNTAAVPCVRALDKALQDMQMFDLSGTRIWGSNDCFPEASSEPRTLAPGEVVSIPLVWGGLTSEPTCTAPRAAPAPGGYVLIGRLDTKLTSKTPLTLA
jgi:hypothetical protein